MVSSFHFEFRLHFSALENFISDPMPTLSQIGTVYTSKGNTLLENAKAHYENTQGFVPLRKYNSYCKIVFLHKLNQISYYRNVKLVILLENCRVIIHFCSSDFCLSESSFPHWDPERMALAGDAGNVHSVRSRNFDLEQSIHLLMWEYLHFRGNFLIWRCHRIWDFGVLTQMTKFATEATHSAFRNYDLFFFNKCSGKPRFIFILLSCKTTKWKPLLNTCVCPALNVYWLLNPLVLTANAHSPQRDR